MTDHIRTSLTSRLEQQLSEQLAKEERDREQAIEDARKAAGAFPTLGGLAAPVPLSVDAAAFNPRPANQTHKVLSLGNTGTKKGKGRVTVTSYTTTPVPSRPLSRASPAEEVDPEPVRIPKPKDGVPFVGKLDATRPWADLRNNEEVRYIPAPTIEGSTRTGEVKGGPEKRSRRNKGGKGKENDGKDGGIVDTRSDV